VDPKVVSELLTKLAKRCREKELKKAEVIATRKITKKDLRAGWSFPKKEKLLDKWGKWDKKFEEQSQDLKRVFLEHFVESKKLIKEEAERSQMPA